MSPHTHARTNENKLEKVFNGQFTTALRLVVWIRLQDVLQRRREHCSTKTVNSRSFNLHRG